MSDSKIDPCVVISSEKGRCSKHAESTKITISRKKDGMCSYKVRSDVSCYFIEETVTESELAKRVKLARRMFRSGTGMYKIIQDSSDIDYIPFSEEEFKGLSRKISGTPLTKRDYKTKPLEVRRELSKTFVSEDITDKLADSDEMLSKLKSQQHIAEQKKSYRTLCSMLQPGQEYVAEISKKFGFPISVKIHGSETDSCFQKAELLGVTPEHVIKAVYLSVLGDTYGFIFPETGTHERPKSVSKADIEHALPLAKGKLDDKLARANVFGMEFGTCTPFFIDKAGIEPVKKLFVYDYPYLDDKVVDISIGGKGERAHKASLHLMYKHVYAILRLQFGDRIEQVRFSEG